MKPKRKVGRPRKVIDYALVDRLAMIQCTQQEIASWIGVSIDTLQRDDRFCGIYKNAMEKGRMSLRRYQWKALKQGNTAMLIWLGKQYLGQRDHFEHNITASEDGLRLLAAAAERVRNMAREVEATLIEHAPTNGAANGANGNGSV